MYILIIGATGFIGRNLITKLLQNNGKIIAFSHNKKRAQKILPKNVRIISSFDEILKDKIDVVVNLAGESIAQRWTKSAKKRIFNSRIKTTQNLVEYCKNAKHKPELLISGSAIGYYDSDSEKFLDEETKINKNNKEFAANLCRSWEEEALKATKFGVSVSLLRIAVVLGKNGGTLAKMLPAFKVGLGGKLGLGNQYFSWIHIDDLIAIILYLINNGKVKGAVNASSPYPITNSEFTKTLGEVLKKPTFFTMPEFLLKLLFGQMAKEIMLASHRVLPRRMIASGYKFKYPKINQALEEILKK